MDIKAREILDSRGKPTLEVKLRTPKGIFLASVPSGTSKGKYEAAELEAGIAVENINTIISRKLQGKSLPNQKALDKSLDKKLGANAVLAVSIAVSRAGAKEKELPLWQYIRWFLTNRNIAIATDILVLPRPCILLVEGGLHGDTKLDIQEFMAIPEGKSFKEQFLRGKKIYENLKKNLKNKFGRRGVAVGLEGAFTPPVSDAREVLDLIMEAAKGYNVRIGLDFSASNIKKEKYNVAFYQKLARDYPILFLEDPFGEEEWKKWRELNLKLKAESSKLLVVGDDLTVTNPKRIKQAHKNKACSAVIIKPNQIGTVSEAITAAKLVKKFGWKVIVSHRSGETKDDFIADFAVGVGADFIKAGAPSQKERMVKYNRLLKIEKEMPLVSQTHLAQRKKEVRKLNQVLRLK
jgi:enolase